MAGDAPWSVRTAQAVVNGVDRVVDIVMAGFAALHGSPDERGPKPPLAAVRRVSALGAKSAKWSFIMVFAQAAILLVGAALVVPRHHANPAPAGVRIPATTNSRTIIDRHCRSGAYRAFPEIEQAECANRPNLLPARQGDRK